MKKILRQLRLPKSAQPAGPRLLEQRAHSLKTLAWAEQLQPEAELPVWRGGKNMHKLLENAKMNEKNIAKCAKSVPPYWKTKRGCVKLTARLV